MTRVIPVLLSGGSGTRLWPVSRKSFPKQFAPLVGTESLFQASALALLLSALLHGQELVAIRRLRHLPGTLRPAGMPPMILPPHDRSFPHDIPRPASA